MADFNTFVKKLYDEGVSVAVDDFALDYLRMSQAERERMERETAIRLAVSDDAHRLAELSAETMTEPWGEISFSEAIDSKRARVYILGDFLGYAVAYVTADEAELPQIAIATEHRGHGYGSRLLKHVMEDSRERGASNMYLEVRAGNEAAKRLYESCRMEMTGSRKDFYREPTEDAILYRKDLRG